jgi:hypothetical protein
MFCSSGICGRIANDLVSPNNCPKESIPKCGAKEVVRCAVPQLYSMDPACIYDPDPADSVTLIPQSAYNPNPNQFPPAQPNCKQNDCKCYCMPAPDPIRPIQDLIVIPYETSVEISFSAYDSHTAKGGFLVGEDISVLGGPIRNDNSEPITTFSKTTKFEGSYAGGYLSDYHFDNLEPVTYYWFKITNASIIMADGSFMTMCQVGNSCPTEGTVCVKGREDGTTDCVECGTEGRRCCGSDTNKLCDNPYACEPTPFASSEKSCQWCPQDQPLPVSGECKSLPTTASIGPMLLDNSKMGSIVAELMNGIAMSPDNYYWINQYTIYKVPRRQGTMAGPKDYNDNDYSWSAVGIPDALASRGYNHFGDGDFYNGYLYVPATSNDDPSYDTAVLVFDSDLTIKYWGRIPHGGSAWVAINPLDGKLYAGGGKGFGKVAVYDISNLKEYNDIYSDFQTADLPYLGTIVLDYKYPHPVTRDEGVYWEQGGDFSDNGILYHILDNAWDENSDWSGVHAFQLLPMERAAKPLDKDTEIQSASEITLRAEDFGFMHVIYNPREAGSRRQELEGITVERHGPKQTSVILVRLQNNWNTEDEVVVYQWMVDEP